MPHENGRIYIDKTTTPYRGVSFSDVEEVLGSSSTDLGHLCVDQNINMLSRRKPTMYGGFDSGETQAAYGSGGDSTAYAIVKTVSTFSTSTYGSNDVGKLKFVGSGAPQFTSAWALERPVTRFRLLDFNEYLHYGALPYPATYSRFPYETAVNLTVLTGNYLRASAMIRFNLDDAMASVYAGLLGMQNLLGEHNTSPLNLDLRLGLSIRVKSSSEGGSMYRNTPLSMFYISSENLADYEDGVFCKSITTDDPAVVNHWSGMDSAFLTGEVAYVYPFIAKLDGNYWRCYGLGATTPPSAQITIGTNTEGEWMGDAMYIRLTAMELDGGRYVYYINNASDVNLLFGGASSVQNYVYGTIPIAIGASGVSYCTPAEVTLGSQPVTGGYWYYNKSNGYNATAFNGWSTAVDPVSRVGSVIVKPIDTHHGFTMHALVNTPQSPLHLVGDVEADPADGYTVKLQTA